jgi:FkbM family methyltransferase
MKIPTDFNGRIIQVVEALDVGDAVSNQVIALDGIMREFGLASFIVVKWMHQDVSSKCVTVDQLQPTDEDIVIYHSAGYSEHTLQYVLDAYCTRVLLYHNITPHEFFDPESPLYSFCQKGREQLASVIPAFHHFWADSQYNLDELIALGAPQDRGRVIPIIVPKPKHASPVEKVPGAWLFLGRIAANKGQLELVEAFLKANRLEPAAASRLFLVGGFDEAGPYYRSLKKLVDQRKANDRIVLAGKVSEDQKEAYLRKSAVMVSFSRHEGFGVPLIEAPLRDTPVVALSGTAVDETMGGGAGIAPNASAAIRLAIRAVSDSEFRDRLLAEQVRNAARFESDAVRPIVYEALKAILPARNQYRTISVVICTLDRRDFLERCLDYLAYQSNSQFEVVVVDGPSTDGTKELLAEWEGRIKVVHNPHRNLSISRNLGAEAAAGDIVAYIDDDAIPFADWTETLLREFNRRPLTTAAVGGPCYLAGSLKFQIEDIGFNKFAEALPNAPREEIGRNGWLRSLIGTNTAFSRSHIKAVGGFDEQYDYFLDESDLTFRIQASGSLVAYCPDLHLRHEFARSENRKSRYSFNWFSICKNTSYFVACYSGLTGQKLRDYLSERLQRERAAPLDAALDAGEITKKQHSKMVGEIWRGMEQGLLDATRGVLTRHLAESSPDFRRFETKSDFPRVGIEVPKLHICIVSKEFPPFGASGGIGTLYYHLAGELLLLGHEVTVVLPAASSSRYEQGRFHIRYVERSAVNFGQNAPATASNLSWSLQAASAVADIHNEHPIDVIDSALWDTEALALALVDHPRPPVVVRLVTPFSVAAGINGWSMPDQVADQYVAAEKSLINNADAVVGISNSIVRTIGDVYGFQPDRRWTVSHCGIAYWPLFDWAADYNELAGEREIGQFIKRFSKIVLFVGRLERRKGVDTLLEASADFLNKNKDVGLVLAGQDIEGWEERAQTVLPAKLRSRVLFTGNVSDSTREKLLARAYCLVFPSRYESFGLVPLEAFVHGVPVIAARAGAIPEVVADKSSGLLFEVENAEELAARVNSLLGSAELREELSAGARGAIRRFSSRSSAIRAIDLYSSLVGNLKGRKRQMSVPRNLRLVDFPQGVPDPVKIAVGQSPGFFDEIISAQQGHSANVQLLRQIVDPAGVLIDIGANIGTIALPVAQDGANVLAIELLPCNVQKLMAAVLANQFSNVKVLQAGVSSSDGLLHYGGEEAWAQVKSEGPEAVALTLDTIWQQINLESPDFLRRPITLKIDVEGHEAEVLKGAERLIREHRPSILFEAIAWPGVDGLAAARAKNFLAERNYSLFLVRNNILVPRSAKDVQEGLVSDFLAIPEERMAEVEARLSSAEIRELQMDEVAEWMDELVHATDAHKAHLLSVADRYADHDYLIAFREPLMTLTKHDNAELRDAAASLLQRLEVVVG